MARSPAEPDEAPKGQEEPRHLVVGHISKPHGTRGEVFVWPLTDDPERVFAAGEEVLVAEADGDTVPDEEWAPLLVQRRRPFKRGLLVKFEGLEDRTAVEPLAGRYLVVPLERLAPLEEGEVYYHQLLGAEVVTVEGEVVGRVREVFDTEPANLLEVKRGEKLHLIPFTERIVKEVDVKRKRLVIEPPAGLLEI